VDRVFDEDGASTVSEGPMTILCYHSVDPAWDSPLAVRPDEFEAHCRWLARHRTVVPLADAVDHLDAAGRLPRGWAVLTFDDGFAGVLEHALPVLDRYGLPATVFLVAATLTDEGLEPGWVRTPPSWPITTLTRAEVREMQSHGVDFQSHSWAHLDLVELDHDRCVDDLRRSKALLEDVLGHPVSHLAYPRGLHDADVRRAAEEAGYSHAYALPEGKEPAGRYAVPRVGVHRGNGPAVLAAKCTPSYLRVRNGAVGAAARRLRRLAHTGR
jgi:peptidoglycan/xylan/chitin deacetylase (PgdA/CDA1 family)